MIDPETSFFYLNFCSAGCKSLQNVSSEWRDSRIRDAKSSANQQLRHVKFEAAWREIFATTCGQIFKQLNYIVRLAKLKIWLKNQTAVSSSLVYLNFRWKEQKFEY